MTPEILVVDDSLTVRMDLHDALARGGFAATLCADAAGARRELSERRYALIVLDVLLPDGDGLELLREIKGSALHAGTPVMLLSSEAEVRDRIRGLETGADEYVGKPYDPGYVVARARDLIGAREPAARALPGLKRRVLVVDDSMTAREELKDALQGAGFDVLTAASGEEGLQVAADRRPDALIVDGVLPGIDGATVIRRIRCDAALRRTPTMLLTASERVGELKALEAGADAYLRKDEGDAVVLARLEALLRSSGEPAPVATRSLLGPKKILAVDDSETFLDAIAGQLRDEGYDVVLARSGQEALELLAVDRVDCILLDLVMPGLSGEETCRRMKASPALRDIPLLILTSVEERGAMIDAMNAGADDYIPKSGEFEVLRARIRAQLRRKQFEDENRSIREELLRRELEAAEAKAARDLAELRASILETISDAFFALDQDWRFVYVNQPLEEIFGVRKADLVGARLWDRCPWLCGTRFEEELRRAVLQRAPVTFDEQLPSERWIEVRVFPHADGLSAYLRDVTERRRAAEVRSHLLGIVGHDLRSPLTAIRTTSDVLLRSRSLPQEHLRAVERISASAARMTRLIGDLLDYSRARFGEALPIVPRTSDLDAICREVIEEMEAAHPGRRIEYQPGRDGTGTWDPDRLQQMMSNLLTNAVKYSPAEARVSLSWRGEPDRAVITVHNEGPPIEEEIRKHLFEPFRRGRAAADARASLGLGLYIVQQIALAHSGSVEVRSLEGQGTTFAVTLPRRAVASAASKQRSI